MLNYKLPFSTKSKHGKIISFACKFTLVLDSCNKKDSFQNIHSAKANVTKEMRNIYNKIQAGDESSKCLTDFGFLILATQKEGYLSNVKAVPFCYV